MTARTTRNSNAPKSPVSARAAKRQGERTSQPGSLDHGGRFIAPEARQALIAECAYYRAERRAFEPGHEVEDWCAAESEVDTMLMRDGSGPRGRS
jgi:hypothetical protein